MGKGSLVQRELSAARLTEGLSAGGSVAPIALLAESGMDVTKAEFWQGGFDVIDEMVRKLESL